MASTGVLTPATPLPLVEAPDGAFLINFGIGTSAPSISPGAVFVANSGSGDISAFTSSGALSPAAGSPVTGLTANSFAATDLEGTSCLPAAQPELKSVVSRLHRPVAR